MSNLATMIMEGSGIGTMRANLTHSYDHENGAGLIAMESAEALRDIFEAEFYVPNTCTIAAALEGASCVEESSQAAIMEASIKGAFAKIKEFFIKLKEKVKDFLHNIKRYLTGVFGNDVKWVTTYEKELKALSDKDLKDYKVKMYNYTIKKALTKADIETKIDDLKTTTQKLISDLYSKLSDDDDADESDVDDAFNDSYETALKEMVGDSDPDSLQKNAWSMVRDGATSESDKEDVSVGKSQIAQYITDIKNSPKDISSYDTAISKTETAYNKYIKYINDLEKKVNDVDVKKGTTRSEIGLDDRPGAKQKITVTSKKMSNYAMVLRKAASYTSKLQSANNTVMTAAKTAFQERNKAYKKALTGAFGYARKNNKGGK